MELNFNFKKNMSGSKFNFESVSDNWWNADGEMKMLHRMNGVRLEYFQKILKNYQNDLHGLEVLDFGCGAGVFSEHLAQNGYNVSGFDEVEKNIDNAVIHNNNRFENLRYFKDINDLKSYDIVFCLDVVEHVDDLSHFLKKISQYVKKDGILIISTINKTLKSLFYAKLMAEYVLRLVPIGVHSWEKFIKPGNLNEALELDGFKNLDITGIRYLPISQSFSLYTNVDINYFISFKKC